MATTQQEYDALVNRIVAEGQMRDFDTLAGRLAAENQRRNFEELAASLAPQQGRAQQPTGRGQPASLPGPEVLGRNIYNMTGSRDAHERYGVPPVLVQSDPYARIAYNVGPGGSVSPMVGYPSVYPHVLNGVVERGMPAYLDQVAAYRNSMLPYMGQLLQVMQPAAQPQRRAGGSSGGGGVRIGGGSGGGRPAATSRVPNMSPASQQLAGLLPGPDFTGYARELAGLLPGSVREAAPAVQNYNPWEAYMMTATAPVPAAKPAEQAPIVLDPWVLGEAENDIQGTEEILGRATPQPMDVGPNIDDINRAALAQKVAPLTQLGQMNVPATLGAMIQKARSQLSPAEVPKTREGISASLSTIRPEEMAVNLPLNSRLSDVTKRATAALRGVIPRNPIPAVNEMGLSPQALGAAAVVDPLTQVILDPTIPQWLQQVSSRPRVAAVNEMGLSPQALGAAAVVDPLTQTILNAAGTPMVTGNEMGLSPQALGAPAVVDPLTQTILDAAGTPMVTGNEMGLSPQALDAAAVVDPLTQTILDAAGTPMVTANDLFVGPSTFLGQPQPLARSAASAPSVLQRGGTLYDVPVQAYQTAVPILIPELAAQEQARRAQIARQMMGGI